MLRAHWQERFEKIHGQFPPKDLYHLSPFFLFSKRFLKLAQGSGCSKKRNKKIRREMDVVRISRAQSYAPPTVPLHSNTGLAYYFDIEAEALQASPNV